MTPVPYTLFVNQDLPELELRAGDVVLVKPDSSEPVILRRVLLTKFQPLLSAAARGELELIDASRNLEDLAADIGAPRTSTGRPWRPGRQLLGLLR